MLTPEYLQRVSEAIEEYVADLNEYLTEKIAQRIVDTFNTTGDIKLIPSSILDIRKQEVSGKLMEEIQREVEKKLPEVKDQVKKAFYDAGAQIADDINSATLSTLKYEQSQGNMMDIIIPELAAASYKKESDLNMTAAEIERLKSAYEATCGDVENFTRTAPTSVNNAYVNACDTTYFKVMHGVSLNTAVADAITELSNKGVEVISYGGRKERIEVAVARAVRTGVNHANGDITLTRAAESGSKYVVVSQHVGARVTPDEDYKNHSWWQGQVYAINWDDPVMSKYNVQEVPAGKMSFIARMKDHIQEKKNKQYKDFIQTCGYGKMLGICGINCRHSFGLFWPGISVNNNKPIDTEENRQRYKDEQKQRAIERAIRKTKRSLNALQKLEATDPGMQEQFDKERAHLKELLHKQDERYIEFCEEKNLKPAHWRIQTTKLRSNGLAAKNSNWGVPEHKPPVLEGKIDISDADAIENTLNEFEKRNVNKENENACVITKTGEIYRCYGTENRVFPDADLKDKLIGAIVSHNHPSNYTEFSFSKADFELFNDYQLEVLRGVDVKYKYEFNRNKMGIDEHKSIFDLTEEDTAHEESIARAERAHIGYRRWQNE